MVNAFAYGDTALVERLVVGTEVAVPVVDTGAGPARPAGRWRSSRTAGSTTTPPATPRAARSSTSRPSSPTSVAAECARVAVAAHEALGLRDLSRSDLIIDADGVVWFLEVNVAPGLTETSTVPLSVTAAGLDLGDLVADLVRTAVERHH